MREVIARLRDNPALEIIDLKESWRILIRKGEDFVFEIEVPHEVLEWYVRATWRSSGQEIWRDWNDYYEVDGETWDELSSDMAADLQRFIERLLASTVRVVETKGFLGRRRQQMEWRTDGSWELIVQYIPVA